MESVKEVLLKAKGAVTAAFDKAQRGIDSAKGSVNNAKASVKRWQGSMSL